MSKIKCFLLDDQINSIERLKSLLYQTDQVEVIGELCDPEKAIGIILQQKPELVFIDVEMPRLSGFDVVQEIRKNLFFPKFIFVTAYDQYAIKAIRAGAFDYILKPIDVDDLRDTLKRFQESQEKCHLPDDCCLSDREREVLDLVLEGRTSKEIGCQLNLSRHTIDSHRRNILEKANVNSFHELLRISVK